jgi:hypothetical protein
MPIAGRVLRNYATLDYPSSTDTYIRTDPATCGTSGGAFYNWNGRICVLASGGGWGDATTWKFITGHEIGHRVSDRNDGPMSASYGHSDAPYMCRCDHIYTYGSSVHCMTSREPAHAAQSEGFANFFSAAVFNNRTENNGVYVYPKNALIKMGGVWKTVLPPNTYYPWQAIPESNYDRWMEKYCDPGDVAKGVELDWMKFFYELWTTGTNKLSIDEMLKVWDADPTDYGWDNIPGAILDKANSVLGSGEYDLFEQKGAQAGVNHG